MEYDTSKSSIDNTRTPNALFMSSSGTIYIISSDGNLVQIAAFIFSNTSSQISPLYY